MDEAEAVGRTVRMRDYNQQPNKSVPRRGSNEPRPPAGDFQTDSPENVAGRPHQAGPPAHLAPNPQEVQNGEV
jgi:hypothetical protein